MSDETITILAIESSCDDTGAAVIHNRKILANIIARQDIHEKYGGVVPELASRAHQQNIIPTVDVALKTAGIAKENLDAIAYTRGPGLMGSLLVGGTFAKALSLALNIPLIEVNHMHGHIMAHFIDDNGKKTPEFPFICLTVSGGHTQLVLCKSYFEMEIIGETNDDAAGEAFDKAAKILELPYPGGPLIDKYGKDGDIHKFQFPKPQITDYNYSFSGLKTSFLYFIEKNKKANPDFVAENINDICASYQHAIVSFLLSKLKKAANDLGIKQIAIAGGVSANSYLRNELSAIAEKENWEVYIPKFEYCTDNAAMIAITAHYKFINKDFSNQKNASLARMSF
jgi:N6-L-threonylcarbamoyladenine synthase